MKLLDSSFSISLLMGLWLTLLSGFVQAKSTIGGVIFVNNYWEDRTNSDGTEQSLSHVDLANNSRIRVRWDNEDRVGMYIEAGIADELTLRHAFGTWEVNEKWQILAGKTSTPFAPLNPEVAIVNNSGQSVGSVSPGRQVQVRFTRRFLNRRGAMAIALVDYDAGDDLANPDTDQRLGTMDTKLPRIDLGIAYQAYDWQLFPGAFYLQKKYSNTVNNTSVDSVTSYGVCLGARTGTGPLTFSAEAGVGKNWGNTGASISGSPAGDNMAAALYNRNDIVDISDSENTGYWLDIGYRFTAGESQGSIHFIYGELSSEFDNINGRDDSEYISTMFGVSVPIDLPWIARGFRMRPEVFWFDYSDNIVAGADADQGDQLIYGVQLQFTF